MKKTLYLLAICSLFGCQKMESNNSSNFKGSDKLQKCLIPISESDSLLRHKQLTELIKTHNGKHFTLLTLSEDDETITYQEVLIRAEIIQNKSTIVVVEKQVQEQGNFRPEIMRPIENFDFKQIRICDAVCFNDVFANNLEMKESYYPYYLRPMEESEIEELYK